MFKTVRFWTATIIFTRKYNYAKNANIDYSGAGEF